MKFDGVNKGLPPCPEKDGLHGMTICIVPPDAALKSHVNIAQPPSSNHENVEDPKVSTQKNSSHCSTGHESLATQVALPDASSAAFCSIDHNEDLADFLASFFPDRQGLTNAKGASTNIDPMITEQLETRQGNLSTLSSFLLASSPGIKKSLMLLPVMPFSCLQM